MNDTSTKRNAKAGVAGALLVLCCIAGPAVLGAIGGAATGSVALGAVVAACVAGVVYAGMQFFRRRTDC